MHCCRIGVHQVGESSFAYVLKEGSVGWCCISAKYGSSTYMVLSDGIWHDVALFL